MELSAEQQHKILQRLVNGETMQQICDSLGVHRWDMWNFRQDHPAFDRLVARAEAEGIDSQTDRLATIYEEEGMKDPQRARGVSDNIKWLAARRRQDKYGDRMSLDVTERVDVGGALIEARKRSGVPICDQSEQGNTQDVEYYEVLEDRASGCQPDDSEQDEEGGDIFS